MMCPKCNREMVNGYLQSSARGGGITWVSKLLPMGMGFWKSDAIVVSEELKFNVVAIPTHICKHCKLLLGDYSHKK